MLASARLAGANDRRRRPRQLGASQVSRWVPGVRLAFGVRACGLRSRLKRSY